MSQNFDVLDFLKQLQSQPTSAYGVSLLSNSKTKWSARFDTWAKPLSDTEDQKCENAESMIRTALSDHSELQNLNIEVFAQGSYKANTNVRLDSDVDISVRCSNTIHFSLPPGLTMQDLGFSPATLNFNAYKEKVGRALYDKFGYGGVKLGSKSYKILPNTYRISSDVVPTFEYRKYYYIGSELYYKTGSCFYAADGTFIVNWPTQTYKNGVAKNDRTARRYKKVVRVLKGLRNEMDESGYASAKKISSFQLSCLAYNISDNFYGEDTLYDDVKAVSGQIWYHAYEPSLGGSWTEIDEIKPMFPSDKPTSKKEVADFLWDLRAYAELMEK